MHVRRWLVTLALCFSGVVFAGTVTVGDMSPARSSGAGVPGIGVDYFVYDTGAYNPEQPSGQSNNWYTPGHNFKTPIGLSNLEPSLVDSQLSRMRASGMDWITIQIQIDNFKGCETNGSGSCNDGFVDGIWGEINDYSSYALPSQEQTNLRNMLAKIRSLGFRHVVIRFMNYSPGINGAFDETNYQAAWNMIVKTRAITYQALDGAITKPLFDLDGEGPGSPAADRQHYDRRLWSDYTYTFGSSDTVGFSIIGDNYHLANGIPIFGSIKPAIYAFDIYGDVGQGLVNAWNALGSEKSKPIMIMETYSNDAQTANEIQQVLLSHPGINLVGIMQWQTTRATPCEGCSTNIRLSAVDSLNQANQVSNYEMVLAKFSTETSNASAINMNDIDCSTSGSSVCSIQGSFHSASGSFQVYVRMPGQSPQLMACGGYSGQAMVNWIQRNKLYEFSLYQGSSCSAPIAGISPSATATVSTRY